MGAIRFAADRRELICLAGDAVVRKETESDESDENDRIGARLAVFGNQSALNLQIDLRREYFYAGGNPDQGRNLESL